MLPCPPGPYAPLFVNSIKRDVFSSCRRYLVSLDMVTMDVPDKGWRENEGVGIFAV